MAARASTIRFAAPIEFAPVRSPCMCTPCRINVVPCRSGSAITRSSPAGVETETVMIGWSV